MSKRQKTIFWIALTLVLFLSFFWLFGITIPEIALQFSIGATTVLVSGLLTGRAITVVVLRSHSIKNPARVYMALMLFGVADFLAIAFLLNAMIEETTFFPFSVTILLLFLLAAAIASLFTVIRNQYNAKVTSAQAAMAQSKHELQLLQSRLSPHFLFNTLNNLYGLSMSEPSRLPPLLLKLSELLRYSVYDARDIYVPLRDEIDYIKNYIEFERLRLGERLHLEIDIDAVSDDHCKVPPLLFVVFVENAFKHSRNTKDKQIRVAIHLERRNNNVVFSITNSSSGEAVDEKHPDKNSGFGLDSVRKRLQLLYPGKHVLEIRRTNSQFAVELRLECQ